MTSQLRAICRLAGAAALVVALGALATPPARAADDGQQDFFTAVLDMFGVHTGGSPESDKPIDYHERAPLVLPPKMDDLPKPAPSVTARTQAWPQDPELVRAKKQAAEQAKAPRASDLDHDAPESIADSRQRGAADPNASVPSGDCIGAHTCDPNTFWAMLRDTKLKDDPKVELAPGQEPPREYLTQPPPGYLTPTKAVKATGEVPKGQDGPTYNAAEYFRKQKDGDSSGQ